MKGLSLLNPLLVFLLGCFSLVSVSAQPKPTPNNNNDPKTKVAFFPEEVTPFLRKLDDFVTLNKREDTRRTMDEFEKNVKAGKFTDEEMMRIMKNANAMREINMLAYPDFLNYLNVLNTIDKKSYAKNFTEWHHIIESMVGGVKNRAFESISVFLTFSVPFFKNQELQHGVTGATSWGIRGKNFEFLYDNKQPVLKCIDINLVASVKKDSIQIIGTQGEFYPLTRTWIGRGGVVNWEGRGSSEIFVRLADYQINVIKSSYVAKKVHLHYPTFFPTTDVVGDFEDQLVVTNPNNRETGFPRFRSTENALKINNLGGGWQYEGGFQLKGTTAFGLAESGKKVHIWLNNREGSPVFRAQAAQFAIRKEEFIKAERTEMTLLFEQDSIYHPSVELKIDIPKSEILLERSQRGSDRNPFFNSYHKVAMDVGRVRWFILRDSIVLGERLIGVQANKNRGMLESANFYTENDYRKTQNIATINPVATIKRYSDETNSRILDANLLAKRFGATMTVASIQTVLYELVTEGFIKYDPDKQLVVILDKTDHYEEAYRKKRDYDVMRIVSVADDETGLLSLKSKNISLNGVQEVELSDKQKVSVRPNGKKLTFKGNRDFDFDGNVAAGFTFFGGREFHFDYDAFRIRLDSCDSLQFVLKVKRENSIRPDIIEVRSTVEKVNGTLFIDNPENKSGSLQTAKYPELLTNEPSYVFYDKYFIQGGIYTRDSFFFKLNPFILKGLDSLTRQDLDFQGTLYSANIFPNIDERLKFQPDSSLGLVTRNTDEGYPLYQGSGNFKGEIKLNNTGLLGNGLVRYLDANTNSTDIIFKPKQMLASAQKFEMKERRDGNSPVPEIFGPAVQLDWRPYQDSMYVYANQEAFKIFKDGNYRLRSTLVITPSGVKGKGIFDWEKGRLTSNLFSFGPHSVEADTMNMGIFASSGSIGQLAFDTKNVSGKIDFDQQLGKFKANSADIQTSMPYVKYKTSINEFAWDLNKERIDFKSTGEDATFLCVAEDQDSLRFIGKSAGYDLKANVLRIGGVTVIPICDAYIYPSNENIEVTSGGQITQLTDSKIVCDTINRHHVINRATVNLKGRKEYAAQGFYEYNVGGRQQEIKFDNIVGTRVGGGARHEKRTETRATGEVKLADNFIIDYKTSFKGLISLNATSRNLRFDGFARFEADNLPNRQWFSINSAADKTDLTLGYSTPRNEQGEPLYTGMFISREAAVLYPRVMMPLHSRKDRSLIDVKGVFKYNNRTDEFTFGDSSKVLRGEPRGNRMIFGNKYGMVNAEGRFNIGSSLDYVRIFSAGKARTQFVPVGDNSVQLDTNRLNISVSKTSLEVFSGVDMLVPERLMRIVANDLASMGTDPDNDYTKDDFTEKTIAELVTDPKDFQKVMERLKEKVLEIPEKYNKFNFTFARMPMKWDKEEQAFISTGKKIDIYSVGTTVLNKQMTAFVMYKMPSNDDDRVYIYIKSANDYVYFFGYQKGVLELTSNNTKLEEEFKKMKPKEKNMKMKDGESLELQWAEYSRAEMFIRRVTAAAGRQ